MQNSLQFAVILLNARYKARKNLQLRRRWALPGRNKISKMKKIRPTFPGTIWAAISTLRRRTRTPNMTEPAGGAKISFIYKNRF